MSDLPMRERPFAWVDVETSGLIPGHHEILEVAVVRCDHRGRTFLNAKIKMERPEDADPAALEINGYTLERWRGAQTAESTMPAVVEMLSGCVIAGHNVRFDVAHITATCERLGIESSRIGYHLYDTCTLAIEHLGEFVDSVSLIPTCVALGILTYDAHTAMGDIRMAMGVDRKLRGAGRFRRLWWRIVAPRRLRAWAKNHV